MPSRSINVTINGTGFAADYTARTYGMIPHKNGVSIRLAGVTSGRMENAEKFAAQHQIERAYGSHAEMLQAAHPNIDNIACANDMHGPYVIEAAASGTDVIVLEKPPVKVELESSHGGTEAFSPFRLLRCFQ